MRRLCGCRPRHHNDSDQNTGSVIEMLLLSIDLDLKCRVQAESLVELHYERSWVLSGSSAIRTLHSSSF
jgi:hypothetical protein